MDLRVPIYSPSSLEIRAMWIQSFQKCDQNELRMTLTYAPQHAILTFDDTDDQWEMFHFILLNSLNSFAPLWKFSSRRSKWSTPWFYYHIATKIKWRTTLNKPLLALVVRGTGRSITNLTAHLKNAVSLARANLKLAV